MKFLLPSLMRKFYAGSDLIMFSSNLRGMNLISTIFQFGISATFIVFVCSRFICGRLRGVESQKMFEIDSRIDLEQVADIDLSLHSGIKFSILVWLTSL